MHNPLKRFRANGWRDGTRLSFELVTEHCTWTASETGYQRRCLGK